MPKIWFENEEEWVEVPRGITVREAALKHGIIVNRFALNCGGRGLPGCNCKVWIRSADGQVSGKTCWEKIPGRYLHGELRLACQAKVLGDLVVVTQP
ncbi:MAG: hypothetical protein D6729_02455 [Deltaproteobacteria bacterium]|nr:MAG: hypothetical protein D6729_02455 [Deltaproteobacteria bacterium]